MIALNRCLTLAMLVGPVACQLPDAIEREHMSVLALGPLPADPTNRVADDANAAVLGQMIFFDPAFSGPLGPLNDGLSGGSLGLPGEPSKVACASCHDPSQGGMDHRSRPGMVSFGAGYTGRNSPSVLNSAYSPIWQFWDGRKDSLWSQALAPLENGNEHNGTRLQYAHTLVTKYRTEYEAAFGSVPEMADLGRFPSEGKPGDPGFEAMASDDQHTVNTVFANLGKSVEAYERKLLCKDAPFDRWLDGDDDAISPAALRGARLFAGEAGCLECHRGGTFTDYRFHNVGVPREAADAPLYDRGRMPAIQEVKSDPFNRGGAYSDEPTTSHLDALGSDAALDGAFKTPSLRCVELTAPYMHNGVYGDLWQVVNHYRFGGATGRFDGTKDPAVRPLDLTDDDLEDLVEFLRSLTGTPLPAELVTDPRKGG